MNLTSTRIIIIYLVAGITWILTSDWFFMKLGYPEEHFYQTIKGCSFIVVTSVIFWTMLRQYEIRRMHDQEKLEQLNKQLEKRAEELSVSNSELEKFAYIASHDLQEPLRMVTGFLGQIEKRYENSLDEKGRQYIGFAIDGAVRMRHTIMDLLEYSRVGRKAFKYETFAVSGIIEELKSLNKPLLDETKTTITCRDLPEISGGRTLIRQVFHNLILNAVKYRKPNAAPAIEIGATETASHWEFYVRDNGIGIKDEHLNRIFVLFQRLHSREEYSGTGIGLAICKKIAENHDGNIRAVSKLGSGSTFYFSVKK